MDKKNLIMIVVGIIAIVVVIYLIKGKKPATTTEEQKYNGGLPFPGESTTYSNYDGVKRRKFRYHG